MTLSLNIHAGTATMVEASWPVPPGIAAALRLQASDTIEPGRSWRYAVPPAANSPTGNVSVRVYGVQWLQDGIAVDLEARNTNRESRISLNSSVWSMYLADDKNRRYRVVESTDLGTRALHISEGQRMIGRLLFAPQIAPDAKRLRLLTNSGPEGEDRWAPIAAKDDNAGAPRVGVDLGPLPQAAMSGLPAAGKDQEGRRLKMAQQMPPTSALAVSTIDPIAKLKQELGASDDAKGTKVELPGDVLFDFDKASLRSDAKPTLDKLADLLRRMDKPAQISGHTDSKGDAAYNQKLSQGRAAAVSAALVERGIDTGRLAASGYGKDRPKAPNTRPDGSDNPDGRQTNRRVEVLIATGPATKP
jgi:outer membrane protein OmpA-like peptidoglycan-associated protein